MNFWRIGIFIWLDIGLASSYHKEVTKFCHNNGMNYLSFWSHEKKLEVKKNLLKSSFANNLRSRIVEDLSHFSYLSLSNIDTLIFRSNQFQFVLEAIHEHKIQKSILVVGKNGTEEFKKIAGNFARNCYFYLLQYDSPNLPVWYTVIILNSLPQFIMNKIEFNTNGKMIEDYNLHGIELVGSTLAWMPHIGSKNCDDKGCNCDVFGLGIDPIEVWSQDYNFTYNIFTCYGNDWGMTPKSGKNQKSVFRSKYIKVSCIRFEIQ